MADANLPDADHDYKLYVYVIESEAGPQKVGHSGDPQSRLLGLMTGHPFGLEVVYTRHHERAPTLERMAQRILDHCKIAGRREWFKCSREEAIAAVDAAFDILGMVSQSTPLSPSKGTPRKRKGRRNVAPKVVRPSPIDSADRVAERERIIEMRNGGKSIREIASRLNLSKSRVWRTCQ